MTLLKITQAKAVQVKTIFLSIDNYLLLFS